MMFNFLFIKNPDIKMITVSTKYEAKYELFSTLIIIIINVS